MLHNRDLSWLGFNFSVLKEAADKGVPLYERIKYLSIFSSNLDEFFRVRYPSIIALSRLREKTKIKAGIEVSDNISEKIQHEIYGQLKFFGTVLTKEIIPELKNNGIIFYYNSLIRSEHVAEMKEIFLSNILSFIQPVFLEGNGTDTFLPENNQLYFIVTLKELDHGTLKHAIVNIPSNKLKRFFSLTKLNGEAYTVFIDDIVRANLFVIFPKYKIQSIYSIKFNRDAELDLEEEYSGNLLNKIEKQLQKRDVGLPSRFLYENDMPSNLQLFLAAAFAVKYEDMFEGGRYHHLSDLSSFPSFDEKLHFDTFIPLSHSSITDTADIFQIVDTKDVLLHLPYQSYNLVLSFFNQAAVDAEVTDIYITLYRLASESHIVNALISAAKNGKNVVVFIELKARFDEANNIKWSRVMKEAGVRLVYSMPQIKVHSKTALVKKVVRGRESSYVIVSTGNFNEVTAKFYTDHVLMTADKKIINEIKLLFVFLEKGYKEIGDTKVKFTDLLVSQFNMLEDLSKHIGKEIKKAKRGEPGRIRIKVNNLEEPHLISLLYKASKAGVIVELIVRSVCCIVPGVDNLSANIKVHRIVDRFLEHSRIFIFGVDEEALIFLGSADLMTRNLHHRIEVCVPVKDSICKKELLHYFDMQWSDNSKSVELLSDYTSMSIPDVGLKKINAQQGTYQYLKDSA